MIRLLRDLVVALASFVAIAGVLGAIAWIYMSIVTISTHNEANESASNVAIGFTERTLWRGDLPPGQSKWTFGIPELDGVVEVSYEIAGQSYKIECGYVTGGPWGGRYEIVLRPGGQYDCDYD